MKTVCLKISGKVQGVFFRATAQKVASAYNIKGWIRNTDDDDVEAMITGEESSINKFIAWCKHGPEKAKVENVVSKDVTLQIFEQFEIKRD